MLVQVFLLPQDLFIHENGLKNTSQILRLDMALVICILEAFHHLDHWKNSGLIGADIFILIDIWIRQKMFIITC